MNRILLGTCLVFLVGCGSKNAHLDSKDKKSTAHIVIAAEKEGSFDPFQVNISVEANGLKESVGIEIFAGSLDSTNVDFDWREPGVCLITFNQQDNSQRKILAVALENKIGLKEME